MKLSLAPLYIRLGLIALGSAAITAQSRDTPAPFAACNRDLLLIYYTYLSAYMPLLLQKR